MILTNLEHTLQDMDSVWCLDRLDLDKLKSALSLKLSHPKLTREHEHEHVVCYQVITKPVFKLVGLLSMDEASHLRELSKKSRHDMITVDSVTVTVHPLSPDVSSPEHQHRAGSSPGSPRPPAS